MSDSLTLHRDGAVARLRLDRPQLHNAFDAALIAALTDALALLGADPQVRVVVLEGTYTVTDPPLKLLRRFIPPLRLGGVALDLSFFVLMIIVYILISIVGGLM